MRILLHTCCSTCLSMAYSGLTKEFGSDLDLVCYWYNPNIHPLIEYRRRLKSTQMLLNRLKIPVITDEEYGLKEFCRLTAENQEVPYRCQVCYRMRLERTAKTAKENGFTYFATTLTTSSHQSHELISQAAEEAAEKYDLEYLYRDWRHEIKDEKLLNGLYKQQYCGCVFSEYDRYKDTTKHIYRGQ